MPSEKLNILLPVETINRELDFRLFLASKLAKPNNRIFIGQHDLIARLSKHIQGGMWIGKNIFALFPDTSLERYHTLQQNNFQIIHLEEEGAIYPGGKDKWEHYLRLRLDPGVLRANDYVCTWGDFQREFYLNQNPRNAANFRTTGHPRFDLYKPEYREYFAEDADAIRARYGDFILVNTNLTYANNGLGLGDTFSRRYAYNPEDIDTRRYYVNMWAHAAQTLALFVRVINRISIEYPDINIVIRPHPSEDRQFYQTIFKDIKNVHTVHEGGVSPWLFACKILIHDGCTTGVEAFLADTNIINYKSVVDPKHDLFLPNIFGIKKFKEDDVLETVGEMLAAKAPTPPAADWNETAHAMMANFKHDSFAKLLEVIDEAEAKMDKSRSSFNESGFKMQEAKHRARDRAKAIVRPFLPHKNRDFKLYQSHFYGLESAAISKKLQKIRAITGKNVKFTAHSDALISIETE